jgi:hypothetical protein
MDFLNGLLFCAIESFGSFKTKLSCEEGKDKEGFESKSKFCKTYPSPSNLTVGISYVIPEFRYRA